MDVDDLENKLLKVQALVGEIIEALARDRKQSLMFVEAPIKTTNSQEKPVGERRGYWRVA
jgi:hypothetical protein